MALPEVSSEEWLKARLAPEQAKVMDDLVAWLDAHL